MQLLRSSRGGAGEPQWRAPEGAALDTQLGPVLEETPLGDFSKEHEFPWEVGVGCLPSPRQRMPVGQCYIDFAHLQANTFPKTPTWD